MATSAQVIGFVTALKGSATAISTDGVSRILALGDAVHLNEVIQTGDASAVMVEFTDGTRLDLGRNAEAMLDSSVFTPPGAEQAAEAIASVDAIQQAILAGEDPTALLAPTAAGPGAGEAGAPVDEGGTSYAVVDLTGNRMTPDSGFETTGLSFEFLEPQPAFPYENEEDGIPTAGSVGSTVEEESIPAGGGINENEGLNYTASGTLVFDFGPNGGGSVGFAGMDGANGTVGTEAVTYSWNPGTNTLTASSGRGDIFQVQVNPDTGDFTVTLLQNVLHDGVQGENDALVDLTYTVSDSDGDTADGTLTVTINDDIPSVTSADTAMPSLTVDETVLATDASASFAGLFTAAYGADGMGGISYALGISASGADSGVVDTATGNSVYLFLEGGEVVGREGTDATDAASGEEVFRVSVDGTGTVTLDQVRSVMHSPDAGPDQSTSLGAADLVTLTATITDADGDQDTATANIGQALNFEDDAPSAVNVTTTIDDITPQTTNLVIVFDRSGSMSDDPGVAGYDTRIDLSRAAVGEMLDAYLLAGPVNVLIVDFSSSADNSGWIDVSGAKAYLEVLNASGRTDYEAALEEVQSAYGVGTPTADQSLVYFLSDGVPNEGTVDIGEWESFLSTNDIEIAYAVGIGSGISAGDTDLEGVAWPNGDPDNPIIVTDEEQLIETLVDTVSNTTDGNIIDGSLGGIAADFGADGGYVQSITVDGDLYFYDRDANKILKNGTDFTAGSQMTVMTLLGGELTFTFDSGVTSGDFTYKSPQVNGDQVEQFLYTLVDGDGDTDSAYLTININDAVPLAPIVGNDHVITNIVDGSVIDIPDWTLLDNDINQDGDTLTVSSVAAGSGGGVSHSGEQVGFDPAGTGPFSGSFSYTASDGVDESSPGDVTVEGRAGSTITGGSQDEILVGGAGNDTLSGGGGDDILLGGPGDDILRGDGGDNILHGGTGNDILVDASSTHTTLMIRAEDLGHGVDAGYGFDLNTDATYGDRIDISDVLDAAGYDPDVDDLNDFVELSYNNSTGDLTLSIDITGSGSAYTPALVLHDESGYGSSASTGPYNAGVDLEQLVNDGVIIV